MNETANWVLACSADEIDDEEVLRFDHDGRTFAIYNLAGDYYATDGFCTHEQQHLSDGIVLDGIIECPLHMGQFDIETGEALSGLLMPKVAHDSATLRSEHPQLTN